MKKRYHPISYSPLLTDFYQITMAYGYWQLHMHDKEAAFHTLFRKNPFKSNYALCCGLGSLVEYLMDWHFETEDLDYLASLKTAKNTPFFPEDFLDYLSKLKFSCDIDAIPESTVVFPHEPLVRIVGPLLQCQLLETPILNIINFQTLIATKASRVCKAAGHEEVIEFGMRRAQGPDGALSASRAAYIGGCIATSNALAGKLFDIPLRGTHAHSWVTAFPSEKEAFSAYAEVMPHNCVLLVDTYNTIAGVKNAIETGKKLREEGADLLGIRLDSGDMADLSIKARKLLDQAGFHETSIIASNSLDEYTIENIKEKGAKIASWGVGTNLSTAYDHPALDGVYKLTALKSDEGDWEYKLKISEQEIKVSNPGRHQVRRFFAEDHYLMDVVYDLDLGISDNPNAYVLDPSLQFKSLDDYDGFADLLKPIMRQGKLVQELESIHQIRERGLAAVNHFYKTQGNKPYSVALEKGLHDLKIQLMKDLGR